MLTPTIQAEPLAREDAMRVLKQHEAELRQRGVVRLAIFGSTARGAARADSDIDLLVEYDDRRVRSLLDIVGLQQHLSALLGHEAELADRTRLKPFLKARILAEAIEVFPRFGHRDPLPEGQRMPPRSPRQRLHDMLDAIAFIEAEVGTRTLDQYLADAMLRAATERKIEIVSEATRRIPADLLAAHPDVPWDRIRAIGNILRYDHDDVYFEAIWLIATKQAVGMRRAVKAMIVAVEGRR